MNKDRAFLDANVLFSAAYFSESRLARLWRLKHVELITSAYATEEARRNLAKDEQRQRLEELLAEMRIVAGASALSAGLQCPRKINRFCRQGYTSVRRTFSLATSITSAELYGKRYGGLLILPPGEYFDRWG